MFKKKRYALAITIIFILALSFAAVANEFPMPDKLGEDPTVALLGHSLQAEACQRNAKHFKIECSHRGWEPRVVMAGGSMSAQRDAMENLMNAGVDAIFLQYVQVEGLSDAIEEARNQGIGVYCLDSPIVPGVLLNVTMPNGVAGAEMAYYGLNRLGLEGGVVFLNAKWCVPRRRVYAAKAIIGDYPNMDMLATEYVSNESYPSDSFDYMDNWLTRFGNEIDWVYGGWDTLGMPAGRAAKNRNYGIDDLFITGVDGGSQAFARIRNPEDPFVATYAQAFEAYVHTLFEAIEEIQIERIEPQSENSMVPSSKTLYHKGIVVDIDNVPSKGTVIHELFSYYDPNATDAWYTWGEPYTVS